MLKIKLFISFSSRDLGIVRHLFYSLKSQNLDIWDYSQRGQEIPAGENIPDYLAKQIDSSDYFLIVISRNSLDKEIGCFTRLELKRAIGNGMYEKKRIIPIVLADDRPEKSDDDLQQIIFQMKYLECQQGNFRQLEETVEEICRRIGAFYNPPFVGDNRLPYKDKFISEIKNNIDVNNSNYNDLMMIIGNFMNSYTNNNWIESEKLINYFILRWHYIFPENDLYYPQIIQGVCLLQSGKFIEAEEVFWKASEHPKKDENCFGGLGQVYFRQGKFEEALREYKESLRICPPELNREIKFNILAAKTELGIIQEDYLNIFSEFEIDKFQKDDQIKILILKGILQYKKNDFKEAKNIFDEIIISGNYDLTTAVYYYLCLKGLGNNSAALLFLEKETNRRKEIILYHYLADFYIELTRIKDALYIYETILCIPENRNRCYMIEYARILKATKNDKKMVNICKDVLDRFQFENPINDMDYYYNGFANYLLGRFERAKYDYERSGNLFGYYDEF